MTDEKDTIIDAEFSETKDDTASGEASLIVPKEPGKPTTGDERTKESAANNYGKTAAYVVIAIVVLAVISLYIRGMVIAA